MPDNENEQLKAMISILRDAIGIMQEIIIKLDGDIPDHLLKKFEDLADKSERIRNAN